MIKKLFYAFLILGMSFSSLLAMESSFILKGGIELGGKQKYYFEGNKLGKNDTKRGYNLGLEFIMEGNHYLSYGGGFMVQTDRVLDIEVPIGEEEPELKFSHLPIYLTARICNSQNRIPRIGAVCKAGLNTVLENEFFIPQVDFKPGIFLGIGGFFEFSHDFSVEFVYHYSTATSTLSRVESTIKTDNLAFLFNYRLNSLF